MKVFVTGGTGFIGKHLCQALHEKGHDIVALVRNPAKAVILPPNTEIINGDLNSLKDPNFVIPECDVVIHLAGALSGGNKAYTQTNFESVKDLISCLKRQSWPIKHFLFASSLAAGGPCTAKKTRVEEMSDRPMEAYGKAKLMAEGYLKQQDFPTTTFRPPMVLGPGDEATFPLYKMGRNGIGMRPAGKAQEVSFIDVDDLVDAIILMIEQPAQAGEHRLYYVSHFSIVTVDYLLTTIAKELEEVMVIIPIPKVFLKIVSLTTTLFSAIFRTTNRLDSRQYKQMTAGQFTCSSVKLQKELGWKPKYNLAETVQKAVAGYRAEGRL